MFAPLAFIAVMAAGLILPATAAPIEARDDAPVQFTGYFPKTITCGSGDNTGAGYLTGWEGGSGYYDFAVILNYPGLPDTHPGVLVRNGTEHSYIWHAGPCDTYPEGSTITFSISDSQGSAHESQWYQVSPAIPVEPYSA